MTDPQQPGWGGQQQPPLNKKDAKAQAAAARAYSKSQRSWFGRHKILTGLAALIALIVVISVASSGGGGGADELDTASPEGSSAPVASKKPSAPKVNEAAMVASSKEMIALLTANALKAKNTYDDKRVTVSGFVGSIDASGDYFALDPEKNAIIFTGIQVRTSDEFNGQVANFSKGQAVTVTGKITDVGEVLGYQLKAESIE